MSYSSSQGPCPNEKIFKHQRPLLAYTLSPQPLLYKITLPMRKTPTQQRLVVIGYILFTLPFKHYSPPISNLNNASQCYHFCPLEREETTPPPPHPHTPPNNKQKTTSPIQYFSVQQALSRPSKPYSSFAFTLRRLK